MPTPVHEVIFRTLKTLCESLEYDYHLILVRKRNPDERRWTASSDFLKSLDNSSEIDTFLSGHFSSPSSASERNADDDNFSPSTTTTATTMPSDDAYENGNEECSRHSSERNAPHSTYNEISIEPAGKSWLLSSHDDEDEDVEKDGSPPKKRFRTKKRDVITRETCLNTQIKSAKDSCETRDLGKELCLIKEEAGDEDQNGENRDSSGFWQKNFSNPLSWMHGQFPSSSSNGIRKRKLLTLEERVEVLRLYEGGDKCVKIASLFGVGKTQIQDIVKKKEEILSKWKSGENGQVKILNPRSTNYSELNERIFEWYKTMQSRNLPVSGVMLQECGLAISVEMGLTDFKASVGWLEAFKKRHNISYGKKGGESTEIEEYYTTLD